MKKCLLCKFWVQKLKFRADSRKFCAACLCVLEALLGTVMRRLVSPVCNREPCLTCLQLWGLSHLLLMGRLVVTVCNRETCLTCPKFCGLSHLSAMGRVVWTVRNGIVQILGNREACLTCLQWGGLGTKGLQSIGPMADSKNKGEPIAAPAPRPNRMDKSHF